MARRPGSLRPLWLRPLRLAIPCLAFSALLGVNGCPRGALYALQKESGFTQGCFDPCMCPIQMTQPVEGSFALIERSSDAPGLFREFDVRAVQWLVKRGANPIRITGSGRYRVGGEVALTQQLELDLQLGGGPLQHFDSGLVPGGGDFPAIDVRISINGEFCYDTVIDVVAVPVASTL